MPSAVFPILLAAHVTLALSLFLPSLTLPFLLRRRATVAAPSGATRALLWLQSNGSALLAAGVAATGVALIAVVGAGLLSQPWLLLALALYALDLSLALFIQRPGLRRLIGLGATIDEDRWRARARRQRYLSYAMAGGVGVIGFLMMTKPVLW
jgi:hypothetical protein